MMKSSVFNYAMALAIMLTDHNAKYVVRRFSIYKQNLLDRVHDNLTLQISRMAPWALSSTPNVSPPSPELQTNRC